MNKRIPRITSLIFQGAFSLVCILNIILCTIHRQNFDTDFGRRCADIALDLTFILFLFLLIALPTSLLLNIIARFPNDEPQKKRRRWKLWTVLSPAFYVILWFVSLGVFISSTGGVWYTASFWKWSALPRMKNEAGLRPMKRAFGSRKSNCALRFMAATPPLHRSRKASASYRRKPMLHWQNVKCMILFEGRWYYGKR